MAKIINLQDPKMTKEEIKQKNLENYGNKIKKYRTEAGITAESLAEKLHVSIGSIRNWECGIAKPDLDCLFQLFSILDVEPNQFFSLKGVGSLLEFREKNLLSHYRSLDAAGKEDLETYAEAMSNKIYRRKLINAFNRMRVVEDHSRDAAAGDGADWPDHPETTQSVLYANPFVSRANEIITVCGRSMEPQFHDGDRVLIEYCSDLQSGDIGIFYVPGMGGVIKQKAYDRLHSLNPDYDDIFPYEEGAKVVGRVLAVIDDSMTPSQDDLSLFVEALHEKEDHPDWFE